VVRAQTYHLFCEWVSKIFPSLYGFLANRTKSIGIGCDS